MYLYGTRLGVPPPMYMVCISLSLYILDLVSISLFNVLKYSSYVSSQLVHEKNAQYGHLAKQNGIWM